jgi:hypothetical protein
MGQVVHGAAARWPQGGCGNDERVFGRFGVAWPPKEVPAVGAGDVCVCSGWVLMISSQQTPVLC